MKKMMLVMAAATLVAGATVQAQSETVTSVNVVGYYSVTIPANGIALVTPVLESFDAGTVADIFGDQLPNNSTIFIWDRIQNTYRQATRTARGGWGTGGTNLILRGDGVWVVPAKLGTPTTITFMGEVPGKANQAETSTVANIAGVDAVGYTYPTDIAWSNTALYTQLGVNSSIHVWDIDLQKYNTYTRTSRGGWGAAASLTIKAGHAFWVSPVAPMDWQEVAPYDL